MNYRPENLVRAWNNPKSRRWCRIYLQQDGFDAIDAAVPLERQKQMFALIQMVLERDYYFRDKEQVREVFVQLTGLFKNLNYTEQDSKEYQALIKQIDELRAGV